MAPAKDARIHRTPLHGTAVSSVDSVRRSVPSGDCHVTVTGVWSGHVPLGRVRGRERTARGSLELGWPPYPRPPMAGLRVVGLSALPLHRPVGRDRARDRRRLRGARARGRRPPSVRPAAAALRGRLPRGRGGAAADAGVRAHDPARHVDRARGERLPAAPCAAPRRERPRGAPLLARHGTREHGADPARERGHLPGRGPRRARARPQGRRARGRGEPARPRRRQRRGRRGRARRARALRAARRRALAGGATVRRLSAAGFLSAPARQAASLRDTAHRPWPLPPGSWRLGQTWEDLLFAHWRVDADVLRPLVPDALRLQTHDGAAWLGITPFKISALRLRGTLPLPRVSSFLELNVRTYVTAGGKTGIWFFS